MYCVILMHRELEWRRDRTLICHQRALGSIPPAAVPKSQVGSGRKYTFVTVTVSLKNAPYWAIATAIDDIYSYHNHHPFMRWWLGYKCVCEAHLSVFLFFILLLNIISIRHRVHASVCFHLCTSLHRCFCADCKGTKASDEPITILTTTGDKKQFQSPVKTSHIHSQ